MRRLHLFMILLPMVAITSCEKMLDSKPTDFLSPVTYFETEEHLNYALTSVYNVLGSNSLYAMDFPVYFATEADEGYYARETMITGPTVYYYSASDQKITSAWAALYDGINRANLLLANVDKNEEISEEVRSRVTGEALFLRAYFYFILVQNWGDVPLLLEPTFSTANLEVPRLPAREIYNQIVADMEEAEGRVPSIGELGFGGRVNKSAVRGILARVHLNMAGYPIGEAASYAAARDWAKKVIDDTEAAHALNPNFEQVFINYAQDIYDIKESLWEVEFFGNTVNAYNETGRIGGYIGIQTGNRDIGNSYGFIHATAKLYQSYEESDVRRDWTIASFSYTNDGDKNYITATDVASLYNRDVGKYRREYEVVSPKGNYTGPINWPLLRYSDVLLMYAEAESEINSMPTPAALDALNAVRGRANASLFEGENAITNLDDFREALYAERSRELAFEGLRKYDLIRWGIFLPTMKAVLSNIRSDVPSAYFDQRFNNVSERDLLFPIPSRELALNTQLRQNPNW